MWLVVLVIVQSKISMSSVYERFYGSCKVAKNRQLCDGQPNNILNVVNKVYLVVILVDETEAHESAYEVML